MSDSIYVIANKIHIRSIRILDERIATDPTNWATMLDAFEVHYGVRDEVSPEERLLRLVLSIGIRALNTEGQPIGLVGDYSIEYMFFIENLEDYRVEHGDAPEDLEIHEALMHALLGIAYSTSRGIVLSRTQGTALKGVILPVLDTKALLSSRLENAESQNSSGSK